MGSGSPVDIALRRRISTGSTPTRAASWSSCDSYAKQACSAPSPRIRPAGGLLVRTAQASTKTFGQTYGPAENAVAAASASAETSA